jgi:acetolactate synthase-1/2/3 large subunit
VCSSDLVMINEPERIRYHLEKAVHLAKSGRPGSVWLDIPLDVQGSLIDEAALTGFDPRELGREANIVPSDERIAEIAALLKHAKRPVIIAGHGIRLAHAIPQLHTLVEEFDIPVVTPFMGIDVIEDSHTCYTGRIGIRGTRAGNFAIQNADLVLSIGSRLSLMTVGFETELFAREAKKIVVDIDPEEHKKETIRIDQFVHADARLFLESLTRAMRGESSFSSWLARCQEWKRRYPVCLPEYRDAKNGVNFYYFMDRLNHAVDAEVPVISDAGSSFYVVAQAIAIHKGQRHITSGALATMGFCLPAAIGVCVANAQRSVVTITGEGSLQQNIQELQTIVHHHFPIKIFIMNNNSYFSITQAQKRYFPGQLVGESPASGVSFPDLSKIAAAYGLKYVRVTHGAQLDEVLADVLRVAGPVICDIKLADDQVIAPFNAATLSPEGKMVSRPLEDMSPLLEREEFRENMIITPLDDEPKA